MFVFIYGISYLKTLNIFIMVSLSSCLLMLTSGLSIHSLFIDKIFFLDSRSVFLFIPTLSSNIKNLFKLDIIDDTL